MGWWGFERRRCMHSTAEMRPCFLEITQALVQMLDHFREEGILDVVPESHQRHAFEDPHAFVALEAASASSDPQVRFCRYRLPYRRFGDANFKLL
jgi:hypothetical protein